MKQVTFDYTKALPFFEEKEIHNYQNKVSSIHGELHGQSLGWTDLPENYDRHEFSRIQKAAATITRNSDVLLVIGVGGSYLGARAAIEMLNHHFYNVLSKGKRQSPQIFYVGHNFSPVYIAELVELLEDKDFSINVISKSGTTMEPAIAFRIFRILLEKKHGKQEARKRIFVTTDRKKGLLRTIAENEGYETFAVPEEIGGRYSVLTAVGLLPMAVSGIDIEEMMAGAVQALHDLESPDLSGNAAYQYAVIRNILYRKGKTLEILSYYEPCMKYFSEWWRQLFGESEGKEKRGIFPATANFSTDLHSIGQYIQEGRRDLFETVIKIGKPRQDLLVQEVEGDPDELNFLAGRTLDFVNKQALEGALLAHTDGGVPNLVIGTSRIDTYSFGYLVYFFKKACAMSGSLLGVNPFDQPGVEMYKNNMFALLEKPGFEWKKDELQKRFLDTFEKV